MNWIQTALLNAQLSVQLYRCQRTYLFISIPHLSQCLLLTLNLFRIWICYFTTFPVLASDLLKFMNSVSTVKCHIKDICYVIEWAIVPKYVICCERTFQSRQKIECAESLKLLFKRYSCSCEIAKIGLLCTLKCWWNQITPLITMMHVLGIIVQIIMKMTTYFDYLPQIISIRPLASIIDWHMVIMTNTKRCRQQLLTYNAFCNNCISNRIRQRVESWTSYFDRSIISKSTLFGAASHIRATKVRHLNDIIHSIKFSTYTQI